MAKISGKNWRKYEVFHRRRVKRLRNHPFVVPVVTFLVLFFLTAVGFVFLNGHTQGSTDTHVVIVSHDKKQLSVPTRAANVGELLQRLNIQVNNGDVVEPTLDTAIVEDNFRVNVYRGRPVSINDGGHETRAYNAAVTPRSIVAQAGITVYPEDNLTEEPSNNVLQDGIGTKITIDRATPIALNLYGTAVTVRTHAKTVKDLLKEKNIILGEGDSVQPATDIAITSNLQIFVERSGTQIITVEEAIDPPVETVDDSSLSFGTTAVRQQGSPGKKLVTYQLDLVNGKEVGRHKIQEVTAQEPVKKIVARGKAISIPDDKTALMSAAGISSSDYPYVNYIVSRESGWCPTKWQGEVGYCPPYYEERHSTSSGYGYGLCQSTPAIKMSSAGGDWETNPVTQLRWCSGYAGRYGGWEGSYNHWLQYHSW